METLKMEQTKTEFETPIYCPCCLASGGRRDAWLFMSEATPEYLSVRAHCRGCGGDWWTVHSLISITPAEVDNDER